MCFEVAHAIGFSQWLMTDFHERRIHSAFARVNLKSVRGAECRVQSLNTEFFRQCRSTALQKTIRYSPLATRCRFGFNWRVVLPHDRKQIRLLRRAALQFNSRTTEIFSARQSRALQKNHSPLATRYSLLAAVSARQEHRPPNSFRHPSLVPRPVLSWWLRKTKPAI